MARISWPGRGSKADKRTRRTKVASRAREFEKVGEGMWNVKSRDGLQNEARESQRSTTPPSFDIFQARTLRARGHRHCNAALNTNGSATDRNATRRAPTTPPLDFCGVGHTKGAVLRIHTSEKVTRDRPRTASRGSHAEGRQLKIKFREHIKIPTANAINGPSALSSADRPTQPVVPKSTVRLSISSRHRHLQQHRAPPPSRYDQIEPFATPINGIQDIPHSTKRSADNATTSQERRVRVQSITRRVAAPVPERESHAPSSHRNRNDCVSTAQGCREPGEADGTCIHHCLCARCYPTNGEGIANGSGVEAACAGATEGCVEAESASAASKQGLYDGPASKPLFLEEDRYLTGAYVPSFRCHC